MQVVQGYIKGPSYAEITENKTTNNAGQPDKYRALVEKLVPSPNDWPKFQNYLKRLYSKEMVAADSQSSKTTAQTKTTPTKNTESPTKESS